VLLKTSGIEIPDRTTFVTTSLKLADGRRIQVQTDPLIPFGKGGGTFSSKIVDLTSIVQRENLKPTDFTVEITAESGGAPTQLKIDRIELEVR
ncbi:MAG: hypothetical protein Q8K85_15575, partial [Hyphomicrobium sp.]|nr:hypothetical protein [Hyphomicrobium sp.]